MVSNSIQGARSYQQKPANDYFQLNNKQQAIDKNATAAKLVESKINALIETCCAEDRRKVQDNTGELIRDQKKE